MKKYIIALDEGTTSARALLIDDSGKIIGTSQREFPQYYPRQGWVEQDPMDIWSCQYGTMNEVLLKNGVSMQEVASIGITNQRETAMLWNRKTGKPLGNAIVWQCLRTTDKCRELKDKGLEDLIRTKTGLVIDAYFSATKIQWLLDNIPGARQEAEAGHVLFGTVDTWLLWNLTGGKVHATDYSNASRTMLYNITEMKWDGEILDLLHIPAKILPEVLPSSHHFGTTDKQLTGARVPITGMAGDQQAALFGQQCFRSGETKNTYGTGCFMLMNTGEKAVFSDKGLLTTIAWGLGHKVTYALEGSVFMAGAAIQWLRDNLRIIDRAEDSEELARSVSDTAGVYMVSAFQGLGTPYWNMDARGGIVGLTRAAGRAHIVRAALESIAYRTRELTDVMEAETGIGIPQLKADGGAAENNFLLQFQSDMIDREVIRPACVETTALGAAYLAGLGCGLWKNPDSLNELHGEYTSFLPSLDDTEREKLFKGWKKAVDRCLL